LKTLTAASVVNLVWSQVYDIERPICLQNVCHDAVCGVGSSVTADTCLFNQPY